MPRKPLSPNAQAVLMDTPSGRAPWPPKDTWKSLDVSKDGWDWASAAISFGIFDPLDLIHFNFLTTNPREVNWYLWKYVGCVNSDDGKNFTFAGADPGVIFLPQHGYTRKTPGITAVEQKAIAALRKVVPYYPDFWHKGVHLRPKDLEILIHKVATNKVDVIWDTSIKHAGIWRFKDSAIYLDGTDFNIDDLGTLVHEATHALVDVVTASHPAVKHYKYIDTEFAAYFAEAWWVAEYYGLEEIEWQIYESEEVDIWSSALYLAYIAKTQGYRPLVTQSLDGLYENIIETSSPPHDESVPKKKPMFPDPFNPYQTLFKAITRSPTYKKKWNKPRKGRGMPGK